MSVGEAVGRAVAAEWDELHSCGDEDEDGGQCDFEARIVATMLDAVATWLEARADLAIAVGLTQADPKTEFGLLATAHGIRVAAKLLRGEGA